MPGIDVEGVSKRFGGVRAVNDVSLAVADGRQLTLLGPSGGEAARRRWCVSRPTAGMAGAPDREMWRPVRR
jgi:ABC-2 type transport system ATP-binding protein